MSIIKKTISVIVLTYNSERHIGKCLQSINREKDGIKEIIVVDNCSQDKTVEIIKKNRGVMLILNKINVGFARGINKAIEKTTGDRILILNPDTVVPPGSIGRLLDCLNSMGADIAGGKLLKKDGDVHNSFVRKPDLLTGLFDFTNLRKITPFDFIHKHHYYLYKKPPTMGIDVDAVSGAYMLVSKKVFENIGLFDEKFFMYLEDVDFCIRAKQQGLKVIHCPKSIIFHEGGASSINTDKINHKAWSDSRKHYFSKHFSVPINIIIQPVFRLDDMLTTLWRKIKSR